jgi:CheY-like chemotaxis protein
MKNLFILIAEDDEDDRFLLRTAFEENGFDDQLHFVEDGVELWSYLKNAASGKTVEKIPHFILLDLNMPKKSGREVLKDIKEVPALRKIPVIVFSTTNNELEMKRCFDLGASAYISKPNSYEGLLKTVSDLHKSYMEQRVDTDKGG